MIRGRNIICIASNWEVDPTSKHHVMRHLAQHNNVLWVSYHGMRRPSFSTADARAVTSAINRVRRGVQRIDDGFHHFTPLVIPGTHGRVTRSWNRRLTRRQIRSARARVCNAHRPTQLWSFAPDVEFLCGAFDEECVVYYCVDEFSEFTGVDAAAMRREEQNLIQKADVVFTTSDALHDKKSPMHPNTHLARHGVDVDHFGRALDPNIDRPASLAPWAGPTIGFFGLIADWVDLKLVLDVAEKMPDVRFVMIGDAVVDTSHLKKMKNVVLTGRRPYAELPNYCAAFDAAVLPFKESELTRCVNPIKLREYLAAGLPVVATPLDEAKRYEPEVCLARGSNAFAQACRSALSGSRRTDQIRRHQLVANESWEQVVDRLGTIVTDTVARKNARPSYRKTSDTSTKIGTRIATLQSM